MTKRYEERDYHSLDTQLADMVDDYLRDPEQLLPIIKKKAADLYKEDPERALHFLSFFTRESPEATALETEYLHRWLTEDPDRFFETLARGTVGDRIYSEKQLAAIAKLTTTKSPETFSRLLTLADDLAGEKDWSLKRSLYAAITEEASKDDRAEVFDVLISEIDQEPKLSPTLAKLIGKQAKEDTAVAKEWLYKMPTPDAKRFALEQFLIGASEQGEVRASVEILNSESFLSDFFADLGNPEVESNKEARIAHDAIVELMLAGLLDTDPDYVLEASEIFFDPESRRDFERSAQHYIDEATAAAK